MHTTTTTPTRSFGRNRRIAPRRAGLTPAIVDGTSTTVAPDGTEITEVDQPVGDPGDTPEAPAPRAPAPQDPAPAPQAPAPSGPKPVITSFTTPEDIDCHNGMFQTFSASWTTTDATKTMISIDGPGGYRTYGPNGSDSLPFNCSSPHTFLLTAYGSGGQTATRTITLQPRNVQPAEPTDDQDVPDADPADQ